ncbi:ANR family transcriptional regulator [Plesiomonas sp. ZOR0011]|uniref:ANR family transcriptional regulator n=1 Tax=Plesiomonas sp. ZOR0011 TaxID=1339230 RepID=UPI000907C518|nr:ANR family transcriptional regulator [Plesiomonas sp. ZOR0011]
MEIEVLNTPQSEYASLSTEAALLEREGRYTMAQNVWLMASKVAKNAANHEWAIRRAALCQTCVIRFGADAAVDGCANGVGAVRDVAEVA